MNSPARILEIVIYTTIATSDLSQIVVPFGEPHRQNRCIVPSRKATDGQPSRHCSKIDDDAWGRYAVHMTADPLLDATAYLDFHDPAIQDAVRSLDTNTADQAQYAKAAFAFVRDQIPHTTTTDRQVVTARASDVLAERTGICHAKANLLAALLRAHEIPAGFGFQRVTVGDDASDGYCLHAFVIANLDDRMVPLDPHLDVEFGLVGAISAELQEATLPGLWAIPDPGTMLVLHQAKCLDDAMRHLPDAPSAAPYAELVLTV